MLRSYGTLGNPSATATEEQGSGSYIDAAWRVPASDGIFVSYCCEPAGGNGYYIDDETSLADRVSSFAGYAAAASRTLPAQGLSNVTVAVRGDGALVVVGCDQGPEDLSRCDHSTGLVLDPDSGETLAEFAIEAGARVGGYDYTGTYLIYTDGAGVVRWQGAGQSGLLGEGYRWASW